MCYSSLRCGIWLFVLLRVNHSVYSSLILCINYFIFFKSSQLEILWWFRNAFMFYLSGTIVVKIQSHHAKWSSTSYLSTCEGPISCELLRGSGYHEFFWRLDLSVFEFALARISEKSSLLEKLMTLPELKASIKANDAAFNKNVFVHALFTLFYDSSNHWRIMAWLWNTCCKWNCIIFDVLTQYFTKSRVF